MHDIAGIRAFRTNVFAILIYLLILSFGLASSASALTKQELQGDYVLTALTIDYDGFIPSLDEDDFSSLKGRFSATAKTLYSEHNGTADDNNIFLQRTAGIYTLTNNVATVRRVDGTLLDEITLRLNSTADTLTVTGSAVASTQTNTKLGYEYEYVFTREETYYSEKQLNDAIDDATADLFTQEEVDEAIAQALDKVKPQAVVIPLFD